tara:strand:+ start:4987 stop:5442 length:456 start_codon:yes stop_codon:yes gene_type:complete
MSNWLFLMLLYAFFGWMKKKQRDKAREKIESQEGWDTGDFVEFGEGILESIIGDGNEREETIIDEKVDIADQDLIEATNEDEEQYNDVIKKILDEDKGNIEQKKSHHASRSINTSQTNVFNKIIKGNNSVQSAIIFKEIFDKPRSQRRKIR